MILTISSEFYKARLDLIFVMLVFGYFFFLTSFVLLFMMPNIVGFVVFSVKKKG
jgi:voltage-gated potassium channel Kch